MSEGKIVFRLFIAALAFRIVICCIFANDIVPGSDATQEILLGRKLASGDLYGVLDTYWAPLYPILIGVVSIFIDSMVMPAALVSILSGALIVPLTYLLVFESYGEREALIAGAISVFFPHFINAVVALGSENVYIVLMLGVLIVIWRALLSGSTILYLSSGLLLGLAYLSRPEAIGYVLFLVFVIVAHNLWHSGITPARTSLRVAAVLLGFLLFAAPYLSYLRHETGQWTVSAKAEINTIVGGLSDDSANLEQPVQNNSIKEFGKYFLLNLVNTHKSFPVLFPLFLWIFVGLGLFATPWKKGRLEREVFLTLFIVATVVGYAAAVIQLRYFYVLLPILIGWMARGLVYFGDRLNDAIAWRANIASGHSGTKWITIALIAAIFVYLLPLNFYVRSAERSWETVGYEERDAGLWLRRNAKAEPYVFSASRRTTFFAEARHLPPTTENMDGILTEIKEKQVDYVVTSDRSLKRNPFLAGLDKILLNDSDFELVYEETPRPGYGISIFRRR
ncbi:MAG: glycosyltransferase family 39 protein [Pyrinomonadaceae bacterium]